MLYFLYWSGIFILGFICVTILKLQSLNEEELPAPKDSIFMALQFLLLVGTILISFSTIFINFNYQKEKTIKFLDIISSHDTSY